ncbi:Glycoprotein 3-alpha-L-fucosyltransferase A [Trichinella papuae]|uniref:Fucosyltransferase n=1 Tax=Trichinella papuae TaxID=268474 RepID=A0A0V1NAC5_9BILA|nr:Glycoprotein 3-alpha-L-fucosyltransferase A [Trichinella papuae]
MKIIFWKKLPVILTAACIYCLFVVTWDTIKYASHNTVKELQIKLMEVKLKFGIFSRERVYETPIPHLWPEQSPNNDRIIEQMKFIPPVILNKTILVSLFEGHVGWDLPNQKAMDNLFTNCPVNNCKAVPDYSAVNEADAVLFRRRAPQLTSNHHRQIWIFYSLESPPHSINLKSLNGLVNWTATYRLDSDIVAPYGKFDKTEVSILPVDTSRKSKMVAWFVSNCYTNSKRELYVKQLQKYISVDIYGACSNKQCKKFASDCEKILDNDYRFYLSFENSLCKDYITEKYFHNAMEHYVIPVVMGASKAEYEKVSPPHSFIHVDDFRSPKELAIYLKKVAQNNTLLCSLLNYPKKKVYNDLQNWWAPVCH